MKDLFEIKCEVTPDHKNLIIKGIILDCDEINAKC